MLVAIAYAAEGAQRAPQNPFGAFFPLILIFAIFYFLLIRPQQKKAKEQAKALEKLKVGDEVVTAGGIFGKVTRVDSGNKVVLEIADKVKVAVLKAQLQPIGGSESKEVKETKE
ncbi:MAG: preprotein translocase subunit YajC [Deltaproteobacteria bacterium]|nr:preprotein translocase subunit YajC [Deltaproteobacteria bacterium]